MSLVTDESLKNTIIPWVRVGMLTFVEVFHRLFLEGSFVAAYIVYVLGLGWAVFDVAGAFVNWQHWWVLFGPTLAVVLIPMMEYFLHVEKMSAVTNSIPSTTPIMFNVGRTWVRVYYFIYAASLLIIGAFMTVCAIWVSVQDVGNCLGSALCTGITMGTTTSGALIMLQVGVYVMIGDLILMFILSIYIHTASRDVYQANQAFARFPLTSKIGRQMKHRRSRSDVTDSSPLNREQEERTLDL